MPGGGVVDPNDDEARPEPLTPAGLADRAADATLATPEIQIRKAHAEANLTLPGLGLAHRSRAPMIACCMPCRLDSDEYDCIGPISRVVHLHPGAQCASA